jgi:hypothetical protein
MRVLYRTNEDRIARAWAAHDAPELPKEITIRQNAAVSVLNSPYQIMMLQSSRLGLISSDRSEFAGDNEVKNDASSVVDDVKLVSSDSKEIVAGQDPDTISALQDVQDSTSLVVSVLDTKGDEDDGRLLKKLPLSRAELERKGLMTIKEVYTTPLFRHDVTEEEGKEICEFIQRLDLMGKTDRYGPCVFLRTCPHEHQIRRILASLLL